MTQNGSIAKLKKDKGFGFIRGQDGQEYFFHKEDLVGLNYISLHEGQMIQFEIGQTPKGPRARNVKEPN